MFDNVKSKINGKVDEIRQRREERARLERERAEEEQRARLEAIRHEKEALLALSDKELMVEAIMALRGYNERISDIESTQADFMERMDSVEWDVDALKSSKSNASDD